MKNKQALMKEAFNNGIIGDRFLTENICELSGLDKPYVSNYISKLIKDGKCRVVDKNVNIKTYKKLANIDSPTYCALGQSDDSSKIKSNTNEIGKQVVDMIIQLRAEAVRLKEERAQLMEYITQMEEEIAVCREQMPKLKEMVITLKQKINGDEVII